MITAVRTTTPKADPATPAPAPGHEQLRATFTSIADRLTASDATLTKMVADRSVVGTGWGSHLTALASDLQDARDSFLAVEVEGAEDLGAKLGADVLRLAEAGGSLAVMGRQRATLSDGWSAFLDTAIADATRAAELLTPATPTPPTQPPTQPPTAPTAPPAEPTPAPALDPKVATDLSRAFGLVQQSIEQIRTVPTGDRGDEATKPARIAAFQLNMEAQQALEGHFALGDATLVSSLRRADAHLEDAGWQLARKPSPDGRFNGVDVPGALRDSQAAADALVKLLNPTGVEVDPVAA